MNMNTQTFWVVWQPQSGNPQYRHPTIESATREAERLADQEPHREFYVLEAVTVSQKVSVVTRRLSDGEELPF